MDQSGGAATRHVRPGFRSLRSPAAAGVINGPSAKQAPRGAPPSLRKRGLAPGDARDRVAFVA
jgi:hypothetical protein